MKPIIGQKAIALAAALLLSTACGVPDSSTTASVSSGSTAASNTGSSVAVGPVNKTGMPIANEKLTYKIMATGSSDEPADRNEWVQLKQLEQETNVYIEWQIITTGFDEQKNLMFASGDYPDSMMAESIYDIDVINNREVLLTLNDYMDEWAPNMKEMFDSYPDAQKISVAPDNKIYGFPQIRPLVDTTQMGVINTTWLKKVNKEMPTTLDEFYEVLVAFRDGDPNENGKKDEIPLSFQVTSAVNGWTNLFGPFGILDYCAPKTPQSQHVNVENGKVVYVPTDPRYKEAIIWLNKLYSEKLIDQEAFVHDGSQYNSKIKAENNLVGVHYTWNGSANMPIDVWEANYAAMLPMQGPDGVQMWQKNNAATYRRNLAIIFNKTKNPEGLIRWFDNFYQKDNSIQAYYGPYDLVIKNEGGKITFQPEPEGVSAEVFKWGNTFADAAVCSVPLEYLNNIEFSTFNLIKFQNNADLKPFQPKEIYPNVFYTEDEVTKMQVLLQDINSYVESQQVKWIMEGGIESGWDAYLQQLEKLKLAELISIYQAALDRYNGK